MVGASGLLVGVLSGVIGVGGGVFLVPIMVLGFGLPQHLAQGTSLAAIIPTSVVGAVTHQRQGALVLWAALIMGTAGVVGVVLGALLALHLPREVLGRAFGAFLLYVAYRSWPRGESPDLS